MLGSQGELDERNEPLKDMKVVSWYVDRGIVELKNAFTSIDALMPREDLQPRAMEILNAVLQEVKELEENTNHMKGQLKHMLTLAKLENEKAKAANKQMEEGINQIEATLTQFGYDASKMPPYVRVQEPIEDTEDVDSESDNIQLASEQSFEDDKNQQGFYEYPEKKLHSPLRIDFISELNDSMAGVEITPIGLSSRSSHSRNFDRSTRSPLSPVTPQVVKIPSKTESYNLYKSPFCTLSNASKENFEQMVEKKQEQKVDTPKVLVKPPRPILSKTTYDILGEEPPAEFYEQQKK